MGPRVSCSFEFQNDCLHAVLGVLLGVDYTVGGTAVRPDEEQDVLAVRDRVHLVDEAVGTFDRVPVDFEDDIARGKTGIICRAGGSNALNCRTLDLRRHVQLRAKVGCKVCDRNAKLAVLLVA